MMDVPELTTEHRISITRGGQMIIPRSTYAYFNMDGMMVKVQWDPIKKALALKQLFADFENTGGWDKKTMRQLKVNMSGKNIRVPIGRLLKNIGLLGKQYNSIVMEKYTDTVDRRNYYYVILNKQNETVSTGKGQGSEAEVTA